MNGPLPGGGGLVLVDDRPASWEPAEVARAAASLDAAGRSLDELASACPRERAEVLAAAALVVDAGLADRLLEATWRGVDARVALAGASRVAVRFPVDRALVWSARLRDGGLAAFCPLVGGARDLEQRPSERARRAAVAWRAFADADARALAVAAASEIASRSVSESLNEELAVLAPDVRAELDAIVGEVAGGPGRPSRASDGTSTRVSVVVTLSDADPAGSAERWEELVGSGRDELVAAVLAPHGSSGAAVESTAGASGLDREPSGALAVAAKHRAACDAVGDVLVFVDGSLHPAPAWLDGILRTFEEHPDVAVVAPFVRCEPPAGSPESVACGVEVLLDARYAPTLALRPCPVPPDARGRALPVGELQSGAAEAVAVRRSAFARVGGFETSLPEPFATTDLCLRIGALGLRVASAPQSSLRRLATRHGVVPRPVTGGAEQFDRRWLGVVGPDLVVGFVPGGRVPSREEA